VAGSQKACITESSASLNHASDTSYEVVSPLVSCTKHSHQQEKTMDIAIQNDNTDTLGQDDAVHKDHADLIAEYIQSDEYDAAMSAAADKLYLDYREGEEFAEAIGEAESEIMDDYTQSDDYKAALDAACLELIAEFMQSDEFIARVDRASA